jgi:hypothetical protein
MRGHGSIARLYKNQEHERKEQQHGVTVINNIRDRDQQHEITGIKTWEDRIQQHEITVTNNIRGQGSTTWENRNKKNMRGQGSIARLYKNMIVKNQQHAVTVINNIGDKINNMI